MDDQLLAGTERFEVKFLGQASAQDVIETWIREHAAGFVRPYPPRFVNSTYFDTYDLGAFEENLVGASAREKVRLRWYGREPESDRSTLEVKLRRNKLGWKLSYPVVGVPRHDVPWQTLRADLRRQLPDDARVRFDLNPAVALVNQYYRHYFVSGDGRVRLTVDTDLKAFDQRFGRTPRLERSIDMPAILVVEFKFAPEDRAAAMKMVQGIPLRVSRSSKYAIACALIASG
ncbi:MAG: VTC domain-containing protein [bacterium]|nr:VTC domain-containing protein [bacterium]